jgi:hypothetical protein
MYYEHQNKCRHQLGWLGGTTVSHIKGNLVDLDSELRGQTRYVSKCGANMYVPTDDGIIKNDKTSYLQILFNDIFIDCNILFN